MDQVDILSSHNERLTARVGNTYVKIDAAAAATVNVAVCRSVFHGASSKDAD